MKEITGKSERMFALINTTEYNGDGQYSVKVIGETELKDYGFTNGLDEEVNIKGYKQPYKVRNMDVSDVADTEYTGCLLVRLA